MSEPFRDELAAAHEQLQRKNEELSQLRAEKEALEARLGFTQKPGRVPLLIIACALGSATMVGSFMLSRAKIEQTKLEEARVRIAEEDAQLASCEAKATAIEAEADGCRRSKVPPPPVPVLATTGCNCQPGDPLCDCTVQRTGKPFDRGAAAGALGAVSLKGCPKTSPQQITVHVTVTYGVDGKVAVATVDNDPGITSDEGTCIATAVKKQASVPPFDGAPVRVGKTYSF